MATSSFIAIVSLALLLGSVNAQLSTNFYSSSCPKLFSTVKSTVQSAISKEARMGASLLRLFFHDCFVNVITLKIFPPVFIHKHSLIFEVAYATSLFAWA